jgi:hypothetical protein
MKLLLQFALLALTTANVALPALPAQETKADDDWMWLSCGNPGRCGTIGEFQAQAKEAHEVRCCSPYPNQGWVMKSGCSIYGESDLVDTTDNKVKCFHAATYNEAVQICADNDGYVCSKEEVEGGCTKSSGCGHDADFIWTSTAVFPDVVGTHGDPHCKFVLCAVHALWMNIR